MKNPTFLFLFTCLTLSLSAFQNTVDDAAMRTAATENHAFTFVKNDGQDHSDVLYSAALDGAGSSVYLEKNRLTYKFLAADAGDILHAAQHADHNRAGDAADFTVAAHSYYTEFKNALPAEVSHRDVRPAKLNFFQGEKRISEVPVAKTVTYENLYAGIDLQLYQSDGGFKYEYRLAPGADPADIIQNYVGADALTLRDGHLDISLSTGVVTETAPYCYQIIDGKKETVACAYSLTDSELRYVFPEGYATDMPLVIDPTVTAATLSGHAIPGSAGVFGHAATYDNAGNIYLAGLAFGSGYPTTTGAYDEDYTGGEDVVISKFNPTGTELLYATYLGGSGQDFAHNIFTAFNGNLYVYGTTASNDFPTSATALQTEINDAGGNLPIDIFISVLSPAGNELIASTYLGGSGTDGQDTNIVNADYGARYRGEISMDTKGNVWLATGTRSADFPVLGGFDEEYNIAAGDFGDGIVVNMLPDLSAMVWSSFLGGGKYDYVRSLNFDYAGNAYVSGFTASEDFPTTENALMPDYPGGLLSGFVTKIAADGSQILSSTYWGTESTDQNYLADTDAAGNVHVFGSTQGAVPLLNSPAVYPEDSPHYITGFDADLENVLYSVPVGNGPEFDGTLFTAEFHDLVPSAFGVDNCGNIAFSGYAAADSLLLTDDNIFDESEAFYLARFSPFAEELNFASYFGHANHADGGSCRVDKNGVLYQAVCSCNNGGDAVLIINPNAYADQPDNNTCDNGVFKIDFKNPDDPQAVVAFGGSVAAGTNTISSYGDFPLTLDFIFAGQNAESVLWDFGDGNTSTEFNPTHTYVEAGEYDVVLTAFNDDTCNGSDALQFRIAEQTTVSSTAVPLVSQHKIYPNPGRGTFTVQMPFTTEKATFRVTDPTGKTVLQRDISREIFTFTLTAPGLYFTEIKTKSGAISVGKVVVIR